MKARLFDWGCMMVLGYVLALSLTADPVSALWGCAVPLVDKLLG